MDALLEVVSLVCSERFQVRVVRSAGDRRVAAARVDAGDSGSDLFHRFLEGYVAWLG